MHHHSNIVSNNNILCQIDRRGSLFIVVLTILFIALPFSIKGQDSTEENDLNPEIATLAPHKKRLKSVIAIGSAAYTVSGISLYDAWYRDYERSRFHFYNDWGHWQHVDKAGHMFAAYFQTNWAYHTWRWAGLNEKNSIWAGMLTSFISQTTIEVMDGFSAGWGFSVPDFLTNTAGIGAFGIQQSLFREQRVLFKFSSSPVNYSKRYRSPVYGERADQLFGSNPFVRTLKDYNTQTIWISANVRSFFPIIPLPKWMNIAVGYGAENMFGGYQNNGLPEYDPFLQRYQQFYLSLDADLSRIETDSPFLRTVLDVLNIMKLPFSTVEFNSKGEIKFHIIKF